MRLRPSVGILIFGLIEISVGLITLIAVITSLILGKSTKPPQVLIFVLITAVTSLSLGIGILRYNVLSYRWLLYFSTVIILSKVLIFAKIINLNGALETSICPSVKNTVSIIYHSLLILYLNRPVVKKRFGAR